MTQISIATLFFGLHSLLCVATADSTRPDGVITTSLIRVLAHPEKYQGQRVRLTGYYVKSFEVSGLMLTKDHADIGDFDSGIWIGDPDPTADTKQIRQITGGYVVVIGTFNYRPNAGVGHMAAWPAELTNITLQVPVPRKK